MTAVHSYTVPLRFVSILSSHIRLCFSSSLFTFRFPNWKFVYRIPSVSSVSRLPSLSPCSQHTLSSQSIATHALQTCMSQTDGRTGAIPINDFSVCALLSQAGEAKARQMRAIRIRSARFGNKAEIFCWGEGGERESVWEFEGTVRATKLQHLSKNCQRPIWYWAHSVGNGTKQLRAAGLVLRHRRSINFQIFKKPVSSLPYSQQPTFRILSF